MKSARMLTILVVALVLVLCWAKVSEAEPMGSAFTYQGHLYDANNVADGLYDLQFKLYDNNDPCDCNQIGADVNIPDMDVIDGYFTVALDFNDANAFNGDARWLEIGVRAGDLNDPNTYTIVSPRVELTPTPYALYAKTAGAGHSLTAADGSPTDAVYVDNSGNVGIGTTSPAAKLHVSGDTYTTRVRTANTDDYDKLRVYDSSDYTIGMKSNMSLGFLNDWATTFTMSNNVNRGWVWRDSDDTTLDGAMSLTTDGRLYVKSTAAFNGNVGIGTTSPSEKLEVNGQVKITGGSPGAGKVLTSDGSGLASWQTLPAGGDITAVNAGTGLTGGGASGDVTLNVNVPLELSGSVASPGAIIKGTNSGSGYGIHGLATGSSGQGVYGYASNSGAVTNYGGYFVAAGESGRGVYGTAAGSSGRGVYGYAGNTGAVTNYGGYFSAAGESGRGVYGYAGNTGAVTNYGGYFSAAGESGRGVFGTAAGESGRGVSGWASTGGAVTNYGGYFAAAGSSGVGVFGHASASSGVNYGVYGQTESGSGYAGYFAGPVKATGKIEAAQGVEMPLTYYEVTATDTTEQTVTTAVHNFCALTKVQFLTGGGTGTNRWAEVVPDPNGTWTLKARAAVGGDITAGCHCF